MAIRSSLLAYSYVQKFMYKFGSNLR